MAGDDRYQIARDKEGKQIKLGEGRVAVVYLAFDRLMEREVAMKTFRPMENMQAWRDALRRLLREGLVAAKVQHPHIVPIYDLLPEGRLPSVVMRYVRGKTLAEAAPQAKPAATQFALDVLKGCGGALDYLHRSGYVHRDFNPTNVMMDEFGQALITDFGLARKLSSPVDSSFGKVVGEIEYIAPEQAIPVEVDGRADQYSLAVVGYQLLTGCRVFETVRLSQLADMVLRVPPPPASVRNPNLPSGVDAVLAKALAKKPVDRYATCTEFVSALEAELRGEKPEDRSLEKTTVKSTPHKDEDA